MVGLIRQNVYLMTKCINVNYGKMYKWWLFHIFFASDTKIFLFYNFAAFLKLH